MFKLFIALYAENNEVHELIQFAAIIFFIKSKRSQNSSYCMTKFIYFYSNADVNIYIEGIKTTQILVIDLCKREFFGIVK